MSLSYTYISGCGSVWLERHLREVEAASSNLVTPIIKIPQNHRFCGIFALYELVIESYFSFLFFTFPTAAIQMQMLVSTVSFLKLDFSIQSFFDSCEF